MFRPMRRYKQQLSQEKCEELLQTMPRGVLALLGDDGYPYTVPMDFVYADGKIYFHCARTGHKIDAIQNYDKASFCVMDEGFRREGEWALNISSVIVFGRIRIVEEHEKVMHYVRLLGLKYHPDAESVEKELQKTENRVCCLELEPEHMTGKLVNES